VIRAFIPYTVAAIQLSLFVVTPQAEEADWEPSAGTSWQLVNGQANLELAEYDREVCVTRVNDAYNWSCVAGFGRM